MICYYTIAQTRHPIKKLWLLARLTIELNAEIEVAIQETKEAGYSFNLHDEINLHMEVAWDDTKQTFGYQVVEIKEKSIIIKCVKLPYEAHIATQHFNKRFAFQLGESRRSYG